MRADRLLSILLLLQTRGRMTARELAEHLEVSERTIYRDIEALGMAGIPISTERGPGGGCYLIDGYQTRLTGLTEAEVRALFLFGRYELGPYISAPLADLGLSKALEDALLKLSAALPASQRSGAEQVRQHIHLDTTDRNSHREPLPHLQTIQEAMWQNRKIVLSYHHGNGTLSEQLVEPYGLVLASKANAWYLVAAIQGERQVLHVSNIQTVTITEEPFTLPASFDLSAYWAEYRECCTQQKEKNAIKASSIKRQRAHPHSLQKKAFSLSQSHQSRRKQKKEIAISTRLSTRRLPLAGQTRPSNEAIRQLAV